LFSEERAPPISHLEQPSCFRLVINKKALETLSLTIPPAIVMRADEVVNWGYAVLQLGGTPCGSRNISGSRLISYGRAWRMRTARSASKPAASSRALSPPSCRFSSPQKWSSGQSKDRQGAWLVPAEL